MSHTKRALFAGERDGELLVQAIRPGEGVKTASNVLPLVQSFIANVRPDPEYTYTLVTAMGYSEFYGSNSNTDWYGYNSHLDFNGLLHTPPGYGIDLETDRMQARGWPYGYPTFYDATVYAHHRNNDPQQLGFGDVVLAAANPVMKRVELVMRTFNREAVKKGHTSILNRIQSGERVDVSMGCKVPFDLCSICTDWAAVKEAWKTFNPALHRHPGIAVLAFHRTVRPIRGLAVTKADYCDCMLTQRGRILPDGRKVFVYNDFPRFFDISFVWIGADRTARVMWHLMPDSLPTAMEMRPHGDSSLINFFGLKTASAKFGEIEKEVPDGFAEVIRATAEAEAPLEQPLIDVLGQSGAHAALSTLAGLGIVLRPGEFQRLVAHDNPVAMRVISVVSPSTFSTDISDVDNTYAVAPENYDANLASMLAPLMALRSSFAPFLRRRLLEGQKTASIPTHEGRRSPTLDKIAAQYNGYRLSVLEQAPELFPNALEFVDPDFFMAKDSSATGAGLLLGLGPMIHLLSAHLRQRREQGEDLGTMAGFVADNPTFTALMTVGAGLRAAMAIHEAGGLAAAAQSVVDAVKRVL